LKDENVLIVQEYPDSNEGGCEEGEVEFPKEADEENGRDNGYDYCTEDAAKGKTEVEEIELVDVWFVAVEFCVTEEEGAKEENHIEDGGGQEAYVEGSG